MTTYQDGATGIKGGKGCMGVECNMVGLGVCGRQPHKGILTKGKVQVPPHFDWWSREWKVGPSRGEQRGARETKAAFLWYASHTLPTLPYYTPLSYIPFSSFVLVVPSW